MTNENISLVNTAINTVPATMNYIPLVDRPEQYLFTKEMFNRLVAEFERVLDERRYEYNHYVIQEIIREWYVRNEPNLRLLSKHPNWDAEKYMITFDADYFRGVIKEGINDFAFWLVNKMRKHFLAKANKLLAEGKITRNDLNWEGIIKEDVYFYGWIDNLLSHVQGQFVSESNADIQYLVEQINKYNDKFSIRLNGKVSKSILKICRVLGLDKEFINPMNDSDDFNHRFAAFADCVNPIRVKRHTCISLHPVDFLLMSNGNSWRSCHDIDFADEDPGCYSSGTIAYMLDNYSFIFYTVDRDFNGNEIEMEPKMTRQVYAFGKDMLFQSRMYPQSLDYGADEAYTETRNIVQKVIADCLQKPNLWVLKKTVGDVNVYIKHGQGATCYPDWHRGNPGSTHCTVSLLKERKETDDDTLEIGARPICIVSGERHEYSENIVCKGCVCHECGCVISRDDARYVPEIDDYCCEDCASWCDKTNEYHLNDNMIEYHYLSYYGYEHTEDVYKEWAENYAVYVENRDEWWDEDDCISLDGIWGSYYSGDYRVKTEEGETFFCCDGDGCYYDESEIVTVTIDGTTFHYSKDYFEENEEDIRSRGKEVVVDAA